MDDVQKDNRRNVLLQHLYGIPSLRQTHQRMFPHFADDEPPMREKTVSTTDRDG